jgi:translation initiation factor IF-3
VRVCGGIAAEFLPFVPENENRQHTTKGNRISDPRTNDRIRVPEVRLVGPAGEQVGVVRIEDALRLAQEADLDLVEVAPDSKPPVVKIMDYGKFKYEQAQKVKEARRNQANTILKEVRFRLKIDTHDYETKRKRAEGFLQAGDKVKAMILFRGREQSRPEQGHRLLQRFAEDVAEFGAVESTPMIDGRNMVMVIGPHKNKADAKAEANAKRAQNRVRTTEPPEPAATPAVKAPVTAASVATTPAVAPAVVAPVAKAPVAVAPVAKAPVAVAPPAAAAAAAPVKTETDAAPAIVKTAVPTATKPARPAPAAPKASATATATKTEGK